ncbi:MAG: cache domain-containing protein [Chromatiaceae bacterium]|nr:cache domain-containing protein [Chromatiaceae bacterium]
MTLQAHPVKPERVGQNLRDQQDGSGGNSFRKEIQDIALTKGRGWVDYPYENPATQKIQPKTTYVERVDDLIICARAYGQRRFARRAGHGHRCPRLAMGGRRQNSPARGLDADHFHRCDGRAVGYPARRRHAQAGPGATAAAPGDHGGGVDGGAGALLWRQHQQQLTAAIVNRAAEVAHDLRISLNQQASGLAMVTQLLAVNNAVQQALRAGDADRLLADWQPLFETLHRENHLTRFSFFAANRVCLLRIHQPEKHGDRIERFTTREAERTGKTTSGIELSPLGTFTLRVVQPVYADGALVGYVELGKEIEDVLQAITTESGAHLGRGDPQGAARPPNLGRGYADARAGGPLGPTARERRELRLPRPPARGPRLPGG